MGTDITRTGIFILQLLLQASFLSFTAMWVTTGVLLQFNVNPYITQLSHNLQATGVGQFLCYVFFICAILTQIGSVALSWVRWWVEAQGEAE